MKIAMIADIHGNLHALQAVLDDIDRYQPDIIVCAGDMVGCYADSRRVLQTLRERELPLLKGNHEEYMVAVHQPDGDEDIKFSLRFKPAQKLATSFNSSEVADFDALPLQVRLPGPLSQDVIVCHGTPSSTHKSPSMGIDAHMAADLDRPGAAVIAAGHIHRQWSKRWRGKLLLVCGSVGLPLGGVLGEAEYLLLSHQERSWHFEHRKVNYEYLPALDGVLANGSITLDDPISWLMLDEMLTQNDRLVPFLAYMDTRSWPAEQDTAGWQADVKSFLKSIGRWPAVNEIVGFSGN